MKKIVIPILIVLIVLLGVSFSWFNYSREGSNQILIASNLYLHLNDKSNNVYPLSPTEAIELTGNVIEFSVDGMMIFSICKFAFLLKSLYNMKLELNIYGGIGVSNDIYLYEDFPEILKDVEQQRLLEESISGSDYSRKKLQMHNLRIITYVINKYFNDTQYEKSDLFSIGCIGLKKAINTYDISKNVKFVTYATRCIFNEIGTFCRDNNKHQKVDSLDRILFYGSDKKIRLMDIISDEKDVTIEIERKEINNIIREIVSKLPERDRKIVEMSFGFNGVIYKQRDISRVLSLSQSYVSRILRAVLYKIKEKLIAEEIIERESENNTYC